MKFCDLALAPVYTGMHDILSITLSENGTKTVFEPGDLVWLEHTPSGSFARGTISTFYGVGRLRGVIIETEAFGTRSFPFGQPEDEENGYRIEHV